MRVVVAGAAGGSGTTTVAALLAHTLGPRLQAGVRLTDHTAGTLAARVGTLEAPVGTAIEVVDLGALTTPERWEAFADPGAVPVLAASMTPLGMAGVADGIAMLAAHAPSALQGLVIVASGVGSGDAQWLAIGRGEGSAAQRRVIPRDRALARGGSIDLRRLASGTRRRVDELAGTVAVRLQR